MPRKTQDLPIKWDYERMFEAYDRDPDKLIEIMAQTGMPVPDRDQVRQWTRTSRRYIPVEWMAPVLAALVKTHNITLREFFYRVTPDEDFIPSYDERNESD